MVKLQIVSDLHLEFSDIEIKNNGADVLILAGDIMVAEPLHDRIENCRQSVHVICCLL